MALQKQNLNINFAQGLNLKSDPKQISPGQFLILENTQFDQQSLLQKRNGFGPLASLPDATSTFVTTFKNNLTAIGTSFNALSDASMQWVNKGSFTPIDLSVISIIRSNTNQSQVDSVRAANGLVCTVYTDNVPSAGVLTSQFKYVITDSATGQNIVAPTTITPSSGTVTGPAKVYLLHRYFIIVFPVLITATDHLQYIAISSSDPTSVIAATDITSQYSPSANSSFDGYVNNNNLYIAWNGSDLGGAVRLTSIDQTLTQRATVAFATSVATLMSVYVDSSNRDVSLAFYDSVSQDGYVVITDSSLGTVLSATKIIDNEAVVNITHTASNGVVGAYYEIQNSYSYDSAIRSDYVKSVTCTQAGVVGTPAVVVRSVGLASKAFIVDDVTYFLTIYGAPNSATAYQPTYFLSTSQGKIVGKLAYGNAGSYITCGLPNVSVFDTDAYVPYLIKDLIQAVNKDLNASNVAGVYSQTGINQAAFTINDAIIKAAELGNNLNLSGGFLWAYDGYLPVEQGFHLYPDSVEVTQVSDPAPTATTTNGSAALTSVSATTNIVVGMNAAGTGIQAGSVVTAINGSTITLSKTATASGSVTVTFTGNVSNQQYFYQATYEWSDNQGNIFRSAPSIPVSITTTAGHSAVKVNVPTLRLTYKTANPVKIVIYRWSAAQEVFYQTTSISLPILNDTATDSILYEDINSDSTILGNNIIYTTGGVLENIAAPACSSVSLFKSRLFLIPAEDTNNIWYSKQVIQGTPVEMSDLLTLFVAPTIGAQGSTGPNRCLAPLDDKNIIFKKDAIYYFTGTGPDNTGNNNDFTDPVFITSSVGCDNQNSIVMIPSGLMFQSDKGIWLLDRGLSTNYIGAPVESLTTGATVLSAVNVPGTNQVRFTLDTGVTLMYDYYYGQWGSFTNVPALSHTIYENLDTYINSFGQVFQETPGSYLDGSKPVLIKLRTGWLNLAGLQGYERAYFFNLLGDYLSPFKLEIAIAYDYNSSPSQVSILTPDNYSPNYGDENLWGSGQAWGGPGNTLFSRVFLSRQKCTAFQITITEIFDASKGQQAGAGPALSGMNLVVGLKSGYPRLKPSRSIG
jgi:hypothetical protein